VVPALFALSLASALPELPALPPIKRTPQITYLDRSGQLIGVRGGGGASTVSLAKLPAYVPAAFVAIEDKRFYAHGAFDPIGIARAVAVDLAKGRTAQGASTITQQLVRNLFLTDDQTIERKTQELLLAVQMEQKYSKRQILELYLSRVYFGSGCYGIQAASRRFFGKPAEKLTVREAAALAAVMKSPSEYSPVDQPERSAERTKLVLDAMVDTHAITPAQRTRALAHPLRVHKEAPDRPAQFFVDWADQQAHKLVNQGGEDLVVQTTLDRQLENAADAAADRVIGTERAGLQDALVAVDSSGAVRAMLGGTDYVPGGFNRAVQAKRQAGSAWKPFVYLTAMENGRTPDTVETDEPLILAGWSPRNHTDSYLGPITLQTALAQSVNTVAAKVADEVGRPNVAATAKRLGITTPINLEPAMALGTSQVTPLDMAAAYGAFSDGGTRVEPYAIEKISTAAGRVIWKRAPKPSAQVIQNPALGEMNAMLRTVISEGTGEHAAIPGYDLAGKTGTTSDSKDGWFCGFSGGFTACVWMGRDDAQPVAHLAGGGPPAQLWRAFMTSALPRVHAGPIPPGPAPVAPSPPPTPATTTPEAPASSAPPAAPPEPPAQVPESSAPATDLPY
jgi:penicillin-binding protein 1A